MDKQVRRHEKKVTIKHFTNVGFLKRILSGGLKFSDGTLKDENGKYLWEDMNDAYAVEQYKMATSQTPYVICFIPHAETLHHWKNYGNRKEKWFQQNDDVKCYIAYNYAKLKALVAKHGEYKPFRDIEYKYITELESSKYKYSLNDILYIKRKGFRVDLETRLVCCSTDTTAPVLPTEANGCIERIFIAPDASDVQYNEIKSQLENRFDFLQGRIIQSSLYYSKRWNKAIDKIINQNIQNNSL